LSIATSAATPLTARATPGKAIQDIRPPFQNRAKTHRTDLSRLAGKAYKAFIINNMD
jgi:hypothetical protein